MIREIPRNELVEKVKTAFISACAAPPEEVVSALEKAAETESSETAKRMLSMLAENHRMGMKTGRPCCQDTGMALIFADIGLDAHMSFDFTEAVNEAVHLAYSEGYLRKSLRDPVTGLNTGDNTPALVHINLIKGDSIHMKIMPKGFGAENQSRTAMLVPSDGLEGAENFIVETVKKGGALACPPLIVGVGIGGDLESSAMLAKEQLFRVLGAPSPDPRLAQMEESALLRINKLNIGPAGLGGRTTALAVHIAAVPTHIGSLPVAVNLQCNAARRGELTI